MTPSLQLRPIQTEADYRAALKQVEAMMDAPVEADPDSAEGAWLDATGALGCSGGIGGWHCAGAG